MHLQKGGRYKAKRNSKSFQGTAVTTNPGVALQGPQGSADQRSMSPTDAATAGPYVDDDPVVATPVEASTTGSAASSPSDEDQQMSVRKFAPCNNTVISCCYYMLVVSAFQQVHLTSSAQQGVVNMQVLTLLA